MVGFLIGLITGGVIGIFIMALMKIASDSDEETRRYFSENE